MNIGQRFILECFGAFAQSPQWKRGLFILNYDEWGGFFDHVQPPVVPDVRQSPIQAENFGQLGFRVPAVLASPFARRGYVDHRVYDHTSILRFLEWRFLGAPADGPGPKSKRASRDEWWITTRDQFARNIGHSLLPTRERADLEIDLGMELPQPTAYCPEDSALRAFLGLPPAPPPPFVEEDDDPFELSPEFQEQIGTRFPAPTLTPWLSRPGPRAPGLPEILPLEPTTTAPSPNS